MRTKTLKAVIPILSAAFLLAACGQGSGQDGPSASLCEDICAKFELCDSSTDESDCVEECRQDQALSASYWTGLANCVEGTSCDRMTSELLNDCVGDEVSLYHSTSSTAQGACDTMARTLEVCDEDLDEAGVLNSCLQNTAAYFSDNLMNALEVCFFGSCDQITGCVLRVLDDYDADDLYDFFLFSLGITASSSGGGGSLTKEEICEAAIELFEDSVSEKCQGYYRHCCWCLCWNNQQWIELKTGDQCFCKDPEGGEFGLEISGGCNDVNAEWSADLLQDAEMLEMEVDYFIQQVCE